MYVEKNLDYSGYLLPLAVLVETNSLTLAYGYLKLDVYPTDPIRRSRTA